MGADVSYVPAAQAEYGTQFLPLRLHVPVEQVQKNNPGPVFWHDELNPHTFDDAVHATIAVQPSPSGFSAYPVLHEHLKRPGPVYVHVVLQPPLAVAQ